MGATRRNVLQLAALAALPMLVAGAASAARNSPATAVETRPEPPAPTLREGLAPSGTAKLWWWDTGGSGPVVVLMHPATGSGQIWRYQQQAFVRAGFRVIGYSRRGAAGSTRGDPGDTLSPADDLGNLLAHLGIKRFHLVATAAGAFTAVDYARLKPETLLSLTVANSLVGATGDAIDPMLKALQSQSLQKLPVEVRELGPSYRTANPAGTARWLELTKGAAELNPTSPPQRNRLTLEDLRAIKMPVLLISGEADLLAPPPLMRVFADYIPGSRFASLPESGHSGYWETPELFNKIVISFLKGVPRQA